MIQITERTVGMWFMRLNEASDYMAHLETLEGGGYKLTYRFRYYNSDEPWDDKDRKEWYAVGMKPETTIEQALDVVRNLVGVMSVVSGFECDEVLKKDMNVDAYLEVLKARPWMHMQTRKIEDTPSFIPGQA